MMPDDIKVSGSLAMLADFGAAAGSASRRVLLRSEAFCVERLRLAPGERDSIASEEEFFLLAPSRAPSLVSLECGGDHHVSHSVVILPPGRHDVAAIRDEVELFVIATTRTDISMDSAANADRYIVPNERVKPVGQPFLRLGGEASVQIYPIDETPFPEGNPRLKFFQTKTMSINWVEYEGGRDRTSLSPHSHADFEQGSLAIMGSFIHHLREPWGKNADLWREDEHLEAPPGTLLVVPPGIVHTTEGVGEARHILIDIFAPPRSDFLAKGWMHNGHLYEKTHEEEV